MFKFFKVPFPSDDGAPAGGENRLHKYIQSQSVQDMAHMAAGISPEVKQMIAMNVQALLGYLPSGEFQTSITTNKENLQNLLASSMLTGYFMHAMEYRMLMDKVMQEDEKSSEKAEHLMSPEDLFAQILDEATELRASLKVSSEGHLVKRDADSREVPETSAASSEESIAEEQQSGHLDDEDESLP